MARKRRWPAVVACGALALVLLALSPGAGVALIVSRPVNRPQVIVSLASHEWERLPSAARLAMMNPGAVVLLTRPAVPTPESCNRCAERPAWLEWLGVTPDRIAIAPGRVKNTYDEALAVREYCRHHGARRVLVVTSPYHTRRTLATFQSVFADTDTIVGVSPAWLNSLSDPQRWWATGHDRWYVRYEWAALFWYTLRHQINPLVSAS